MKKGDRVAYIAPNMFAQLESFYAVSQLGAVLVPIIGHSSERGRPMTPQERAAISKRIGAPG